MAFNSYSTDADGGRPVRMRMQISGELGQSYPDFVADRAAWLSLSGWVEVGATRQVIVVAAGPEALVGALEMACVLGPLDALVHSLQLEPETVDVPAGAFVRR